MGYNVAIDGPAGAGKSTIAKRVAKELGYVYVDTGAMYRALAIYFLNQGLGTDDTEKIAEVCKHAEVTLQYEDGVQQVYLNGENVTSFCGKNLLEIWLLSHQRFQKCGRNF